MRDTTGSWGTSPDTGRDREEGKRDERETMRDVREQDDRVMKQ